MLDNLNYYRTFHAVARTGSISKAAQVLYISQPAVSKSISNLEESLGIRLFEREARGVRLTEEGQLLFEHISSAFDNISHAEEEIRRINELGIGQLRIGASTSLCKHILLDYLKDFITAYPHIKLIIDCHSTQNTLHLLEEGKIDLGLICFTDLPKDIQYVRLQKIHDIFITSQSYLDNLILRETGEGRNETVNPWLFAGNITSLLDSASMADPGSQEREDAAYSISQKAEQGMSARDILEKSNLMLLEQGNVTRRHIDRYFYENNINPSQILEINNMDLLIDFAAIGMGVSSVVKEFAELSLETGEVIELPVTPAIEERDVGFAFRSNKGKSQALEKFLQFCEAKSIS